ncbi:oxidoreductase [Burkholderia ubonensis]|uniref:oxidoreductase n=1 Tax=Burkholderia ubonensis TaxID=101571 RepID=UPI000AE8E443|nr:oxidoreductase [Burkholderia ubonensis]
MQPLVGQLDGPGNVSAHGTIHGIPYLRLAGGANAMILDPQVVDVGFVAVCDRDTSSARANLAPAASSSLRKHDLSDSVYVSTVLSGVPQQYVALLPDGINIVSPKRIRLSAPSIAIQASNDIGMMAGGELTKAAPAIALDGAVTQGKGPERRCGQHGWALIVQRDVVADGKSVHDHTHRDSQGGTTSPPI